jgi:hypothetical protein
MRNEPSPNLLADLRRRVGVSQNEMVWRLNCSQSKISKIEAAHTGNVTLNELAAYVAATQLPIRLQFFGEGMEISFMGEDAGPTPISGGNGAHQTLPKPAPATNQQIASLKSEIARLEIDKDLLEATIAELKAMIAKSEVTVAHLRAQLDGSQRRNGELAAMLERSFCSHRQEVAALQRKVEQAEPCRELLEQLARAKAEFKVAWELMHQGQRLQIQHRLLSAEQRCQRSVMVHEGRSVPPLSHLRTCN